MDCKFCKGKCHRAGCQKDDSAIIDLKDFIPLFQI